MYLALRILNIRFSYLWQNVFAIGWERRFQWRKLLAEVSIPEKCALVPWGWWPFIPMRVFFLSWISAYSLAYSSCIRHMTIPTSRCCPVRVYIRYYLSELCLMKFGPYVLSLPGLNASWKMSHHSPYSWFERPLDSVRDFLRWALKKCVRCGGTVKSFSHTFHCKFIGLS